MSSYEFDKIRPQIPAELMARGILLEDLGINEYAWVGDDAIHIIEVLMKHKVLILGGCVFDGQSAYWR